jgi:hypothetical protein
MAKAAYSDIPEKARNQNCLKVLDSGSRLALYTMCCRASLAWDDEFHFFTEVIKKGS